MSLTMTQTEREAFLTGVHVGIVSIDDPGHGPLSMPVWYAYEAGGTVDVLTSSQSRKARHMRAAGRFTLCVQTESLPYCYVSVEGPITLIRDTVGPEERRQLAYRYLGQELAEPDHDDVPNLDRVERLPDASHWVHHDEAERVTQLLTDFFASARPAGNR